MRTTTILVTVVALLAGCASAPVYRFTRAGATETQVSRDIFECRERAAEIHRHEFVAGPLWYVVSERAKADHRQAESMSLCMRGRGYAVAVDE